MANIQWKWEIHGYFIKRLPIHFTCFIVLDRGTDSILLNCMFH
jgi:hypothetical protein